MWVYKNTHMRYVSVCVCEWVIYVLIEIIFHMKKREKHKMRTTSTKETENNMHNKITWSD